MVKRATSDENKKRPTRVWHDESSAASLKPARALVCKSEPRRR
jgi:hypothetical protein